jgi:hypothetical protein
VRVSFLTNKKMKRGGGSVGIYSNNSHGAISFAATDANLFFMDKGG